MEIGASFAFTLNLGNYQSARVEMTLSGISTDRPLEEQLAAAEPYIDGAIDWLEGKLYDRLRDNGLIKAVIEARK